ncbi:MAG: hypothetical protein O7G88_16225 [bacterium]|nr:hypothetical protein [bacterium]
MLGVGIGDQLGQLNAVVELGEHGAAADKLAADEELWKGRPTADLAHGIADSRARPCRRTAYRAS